VSRFVTADEVFAYFESFTNLERGGFIPREYRLERMQRLLQDFGDPHHSCMVIHVAGSKGKGSVSAFAANCCAATGARVGLYMSPHVSDYRERVSVIGAGISEPERDNLVVLWGNNLADYVDRLRDSEREETLPTTFELLTLLAFLVFREAGCGIAVVEVGLGGRLDATNLVAPAVTVITPIELEHTDYLGDNLASVAREKGGIIKPGVPVILAGQKDEVNDVLVGIAKERGAPVVFAREAVEVQIGHTTDSGTDVTLQFADGSRVDTRLKLLGAIQATNAAVAALAVRAAIPAVTDESLAAGLADTWLPGRAELWPRGPRILLDGAHTPESIRTVLEIARELEPDSRRRVLVFGSVKGKQHDAMLRILIDQFDEIIISRPGTFKESNTTELAELCRGLGGRCRRMDEMGEALEAARATTASHGGGLIIITGSFHLIGEARRVLLAEE
jgi:dihydrofolate synthase / folylpolyglutamate synthase